MKDAFGGILNIVLIALFLIIVEGILGFVVNYTKAFKMKNSVISAIEQYEAVGCVNTDKANTACRNKIIESAKSIGYSPANLRCPSGYTKIDGLFCVNEGEISRNKNKDWYSSSKPTTYRVVTQVDVNIPIINKIMGLSFFQVSGDTRVIETHNS